MSKRRDDRQQHRRRARRRLRRHRGDDRLEHDRGQAPRAPRASPRRPARRPRSLGITSFEDDIARARFNDLSHWGYGTGWGVVRGLLGAPGCRRGRRRPPTARPCGAARAGDAAGARRRPAVRLLGRARRSRSTPSTTRSTRSPPASPTSSSTTAPDATAMPALGMCRTRTEVTGVGIVVRGEARTHRFQRARLMFLVLATLALDAVATFAMYMLEHDQPASGFHDPSGALFWVSAQLTTVSSQMPNRGHHRRAGDRHRARGVGDQVAAALAAAVAAPSTDAKAWTRRKPRGPGPGP